MKKSLSLFCLLAASFALTSCGGGKNSSTVPGSSDSGTSVPPSSSVTPPSTSVTPPSTTPDPDPGSDIVDAVLPSDTVLRAYDSKFDQMVDGMSGENAVGTVDSGAAYVSKQTLKVKVDADYKDFDYPSDSDKSIYKYAKKADINSAHGIGFRMRLVSGSLPLSQLYLALRGDDSFQVYPISLAAAYDANGDAVKELTSEFQDIVICPAQSIEDENAVYLQKDGTPSQVKVLEKAIGFHLYAGEGSKAEIEIEKVFIDKMGFEETLDTFGRENVTEADDNCWWRGSTGRIDVRHVAVTDGSYQVPVTSNDYQKLVLRVRGDVSGAAVATSKGDSLKTVQWKDLKSQEGQTLPVEIPAFSYNNIVIDLALSGLDSGADSIKISSSTPLDIAGIFLTNLEVEEAVDTFPLLDTANAVIFDDFNRTQAQIVATDYDKAAASVADYGLNFAITYNLDTQSTMSVHDGALVFDNVASKGSFAQYKSGSKRSGAGYDYMVMAVKGEGGATLEGLRIGTETDAPIWANQWVSAPGLSVPSLDAADYPYTTADGYKWLVVDLAKSGYQKVADILDIYYSGSGILSIDSIFFADQYLGEATVNPASATNPNLASYAYLGGLDAKAGSAYYSFEIQEIDADTSISSFRVAVDSLELWIRDGALIAPSGEPIPATGWKKGDVVVIDLVRSGFDLTAANSIHLHSGGDEAAAEKAVTVGALTAYAPGSYSYAEAIAALPSLDYKAPVITITEPEGTVPTGDFELEYTVTDDQSQVSDIKVEISVKKLGETGSGSGSGDQPIVIMGNVIKNLTTGSYEITVKATDKAGNIATQKLQITVA